VCWINADVLEAVEDPDAIYERNSGELLAVKEMGNSKYLIVVYKEVNRKDGLSLPPSFQTG
jgi:hypothetical protein